MRIPTRSSEEYRFLADVMDEIGEERLAESFKQDAIQARAVEDYAAELGSIASRGFPVASGLRLIAKLIKDGWKPPQEVPNAG